MRHWISAIALGLSAAAATAAPLAVNPNLLRTPAPKVYLNPQRALAVQMFLHLPVAPTLGAPISLTPATPAIPGLGEMDFGGALFYLSGSMQSPGADPYVAIPFNEPSIAGGGWIKLVISGRAGSHYAVDCRAAAGPNPVHYTITGPIGAEGSVNVGPDRHFLFATQSLPASGVVSVLMWQDAPTPIMNFYGCDISPF